MAKTAIIITAIVLIIIGIIIAFNIVGDTAPELVDAADTIPNANNCSEGRDAAGVVFEYNATDASCYNSSTTLVTPAADRTLPLNTLFSSDGVLLLVFMAFLFIGMIGFIMFKTKFGK